MLLLVLVLTSNKTYHLNYLLTVIIYCILMRFTINIITSTDEIILYKVKDVVRGERY